MFRLTLFFLLIGIVHPLAGQAFFGEGELHIRRTTGKIQIDGFDTEQDWATAEPATGFRQHYPYDTSLARAQTVVKLTYDAENLYVFARMSNLGPRRYVTPSLRRDYRGESNDALVVVLDTYSDRTNAFSFGVNPYGVQREGLLSSGGNSPSALSLDWDNRWFSEARQESDAWTCEMAIPFHSIRFKENAGQWNINFYRIDSEYNERSTWTPIPRNQPLITLARIGRLIWEEPLKKTGNNISLIPYTAARVNRDFINGTGMVNNLQAGMDAKIAVSSALNMDLTLNPDFSQVEVDQQVTNLDRFELFFPERRQFFLENADLFSGFGTGGAQPFFSRRIGVTRDKETGQNINNPIYGGARISGKINNNLRTGVLTMQAQPDRANDLPSLNYTVAAVQQKLFSRSNLSAVVANRQGSGSSDMAKRNTVAGLDYNLGSRDGRWSGKMYYHRSHNSTVTDSAFSTGLALDFTSPRVEFSVLARSVGNGFDPAMGFVRRKRFNQFAPELYFYSYPNSGKVNKHGPGMDADIIWNDLYGLTDWDANIWYNVRFQNTANFFVRIRQDYVYLFSPFDPTNTGGPELQAGKGYRWFNVVYNYMSNARKRLFFSVNGRVGQYYNGYRQSAAGTLNYRLQPYAGISLDFSYNRIRLPKPYRDADLVLIGPRVDLTFSRKLFLTTYVQYNNQISNLNINTRLQWRFQPVSDLYLVYTDNYFAEFGFREDRFPFLSGNIGQPKLRAVAVKLSYWFNP